MEKTALAMLCISLLAAGSPEIAYSFSETDNERTEQLLQKYPNVKTLKAKFGSETNWRYRTKASIHDPDLEFQISDMEYPGVEIAVGYTSEHEDRFLLRSCM